MGALALIFRAVLLLSIVRLAGIVLRAFFGGYMQGARPSGTSAPPRGPSGRTETASRGQIEELVRDPVCGVHTAMSSAIAGRYQGSSAYFCSTECAAKAQAAS